MSTIKKIGNALLIVLGVFLILTGILSAKIRDPKFQTFLSDRIIGYLSKKINTEIHVGSVDFRLFNHLELKDVLLKDRSNDTLLFAKKLDISFGVLDLIDNNYAIKKITLHESVIYLHKPENSEDFNFQFIVDAFKRDSTRREKSSTTKLDLSAVDLNQTHFVLLDEPNHVQLNFHIPATTVDVRQFNLNDAVIHLNEISFHHADLKIAKLERPFEPDDTLGSDTTIVHLNTKPLKLYVEKLKFIDSKFQFDDNNEPLTTGRFDGFHQLYENLNIEFADGWMVMDTVQAKIRNISFIEKSGFEVKHLEANVRVTPTESVAGRLKVETPTSTVSNYFSMSYQNFHAFFDYNAQVMMKAVLEKSSVSMNDIGYFMPQLKSISENVLTSGTLYGTVDNLKGKDLRLTGGRVTQFNGNIDVKGLPDVNEMYIDFKLDQLVTDVADVRKFIPSVRLPEEFSRLGKVNFRGSFTGFINDFVAYGVLNTYLGQVESDLNMKLNKGYDATYSGSLMMSQFNIGSYSGVDSLLGTISFNARVSGSGLRYDNIDAKMTGSVQQFVFNGYNYQHIDVDGTFTKKLFTGKLNMNDENINLEFNGLVDMNNELPVYNFRANIQNANLSELGFTDIAYVFSTQLDMNMQGDHIDNFIGYARALNTSFSKSQQSLSLDTVSLSISESSGFKHFLLASDPAMAAFNGKFALTQLPRSFLGVLDHYFPSLPMEYNMMTEAQDFDFDVDVNDASGVLSFFFPQWRGISGSVFHGHFNSMNNSIAFTGVIPSVGYKNIFVDTLNVTAESLQGRFRFNAQSTDMLIGDSTTIIRPAFSADIAHDSANIYLTGSNIPRNTYTNLYAVVTGDTSGLKMHLKPSDFVVNNVRWNVSSNNLITYSPERLRFYDFILSHDDQSLTISNVNVRPRATNLHFDFEKIPVEDLYHFVKLGAFDITGNLTGSMDVLNVFHAPRIQANATSSNLVVNKRELLLTGININYIPENDEVFTELQISDDQFDIHGAGSFFPRKENDQLKFNLDVEKFELSFFETLLPGYFSNTEGTTNGHLYLSGNLQDPLLTGKLEIPYLSAKVDYLQTTYHTYNASVTFNTDNFDIVDMKLYDEHNDLANARGQIYHDHLNDFRFNLAVTTDRLLALKTTPKDNTLFYGTAEVAGIVQFLGPLDNMEIRAGLSSRYGTEMSIPISYGVSVADRSFIRYKRKESDSSNYTFGSFAMIKGLRLNLDLDVTPDAEIKIIFDQTAGDIIEGRGYGNIRMEIDTKGEFNMYGTYTIEEGDYLFTLQNFFNKYFTIDRGGTIAWTGDPYGAQIDINAIYSTKASLYDYVVGSGIPIASDQELKDLQQRVPVDVYLKLTGSLLLPDVSFDIRLPEATTLSSTAYQEVEKIKQDEGELNKQVFGLLILNRFLPQASGLGNQSLSSDVNNSVSEFLLNQLSYWTSQIRSDIDFNFNYQSYEANLNSSNPNDLTKRNELEVALTKRFFNDRLALEAGGNFDFAATTGDNTSGGSTTGNSTNVAGDFAVDYKITPDGRLSGKAFSKSQYDVVDERYKTKNGIALSYKREFNKLKELFQKDLERQKQKEERKKVKELKEQEEAKPEEPPTTSK